MIISWEGIVHAESLRTACEDLLLHLDLPHRFTEAELIEAVSARVGRRIECEPKAMQESDGCGLRQRYDDREVVFYEQSAPPLLRLQIIAHELGHILFDHAGTVNRADFKTDAQLASEIDWMGALGISARTSYNTPEEQEAEFLGSLLVSRMVRERKTPSTRPAAASERWAAMYT
ncbi:ImmA/IrrE family metallo-endopeptidase [Kitasatospora sp. YST-16]|uniref:ImmA/IrrE family metallo-endopeptidase n=1 Tax=Kitasatospora sp. YST-16 TaxID=2998080 RepID=UPI002284CF10|nr:ImmA/IrrE family metallo-endopeptidase [Kitasatospora sp. YST-16]WAL74567.1 ImmA/IrrE family metallo-endopeptidase [Kitasatospora sp. YST-16]WNW40625.1 ImmA/IrrE family metallo-endopeptidase [Streptomyces sp. Li-HN-5-13]